MITSFLALIFKLCMAFGLAVFATRWVRAYVVRKNVLDIPNDRSSHSVATPRGGGLALVAVFCFLFLIDLFFKQFIFEWIPILIFGVPMAIVGWWDDKRGLSAGLRLSAQLLFAMFAVAFLAAHYSFLTAGVFPVLGISLPPGASLIFLVLFVVWMTNLYNFMDGSDGILGLQTATVALGGAFLSLRVGATDLSGAYLLLAGSAAGFLILNWSPAKIFMGDVGSVFCGFTFALLAIIGAAQGEISFAAVVILHLMFIGDATITLLVRLRRGQKPHQAHRSHFYQKMIQAGHSHARVAVCFGLINILWLLPLSYFVESALLSPYVALLLALLPPLGLALRFGAVRDRKV